MKNRRYRIIPTLAFLFLANFVWGQSTSGNSGIWLTVLVVIAVLVVLLVLLQVADNLLLIEAKQTGASTTGANFSIFPSWSEVFRPKMPDHLKDQEVNVLRKGHDILLEGAPEGPIATPTITRYAVQPPNFIGISPIPKLLVEEGATVKAGDPLFFDKSNPDIKYVAPVSGEVLAIKRGAKRSIAAVEILADKDIQYRSLDKINLDTISREELVKFLMEAGGWTLIRQRPFNVIADANATPRDIFISTFDTAPLAPDLNVVVAGREAAFQRGLDLLTKLTSGKVHLGLDARKGHQPAPAFADALNVEKHWFHGKHPAGNVGVQIHHIAPISPNDIVWTLGVQEVITLGALVLNQRYEADRVVALTGAEFKQPGYVKTYIGANIGELVKDNLANDHIRLVSGDVLSGSAKSTDDYLNVYDDQVTVLLEGDYHELFGWLLPLKPRPSVSNTFPNALFPSMHFKADTNMHGEPRAFVVTGQYEQVLPMDIYPQHLMKAILVNDFERMEGLGIHELVEEDVALCEFVCTSKQPLQNILRQGLENVREQS